MFSANSITSDLKLLPFKNDFIIVENILDNVVSDELGNVIKLKCLVNLGVSYDLPPPGGPHAQTRIVFSISFHINDLRS